jgi:electron transfer flavoprotein beta subunit
LLLPDPLLCPWKRAGGYRQEAVHGARLQEHHPQPDRRGFASGARYAPREGPGLERSWSGDKGGGQRRWWEDVAARALGGSQRPLALAAMVLRVARRQTGEVPHYGAGNGRSEPRAAADALEFPDQAFRRHRARRCSSDLSKMRILVCIKEIQNPEIASSVFRVDEGRKEVIPLDGLPLVTSPFDEQAVEAALRIRDRGRECQITVLTFGPDKAKAAIKRALSMGADDGVHVLNNGMEAADSATVARILAEVVKRLGQFDLILTGRQAADWDSGIVGCGIAQLLGFPVVTFAKSVQLEDSQAIVERVLDDGSETVEAPMPCVITISNELGEPRKASLRETMRAAKKQTQVQTLEAIGIDAAKLRAERELLQRRERLFVPNKEIKCDLVVGDSVQQVAKRVISKLSANKLI